ncbi:MAG: hypothetical protein KDB18_14375, partial [Salinibacterium sp.]|nr:hypothetical protein [Salinibacterium sp.]
MSGAIVRVEPEERAGLPASDSIEGGRYVTNAQGMARGHGSKLGVRVVARIATPFSFGQWRSGPAPDEDGRAFRDPLKHADESARTDPTLPVEIVLRPAREIFVRVVDPWGHPAPGIKVLLTLEDETWDHGVSQDDGIARIVTNDLHSELGVLRTVIIGVPVVEISLPLASNAAAPLVFTVPAHGSIVAQVIDPRRPELLLPVHDFGLAHRNDFPQRLHRSSEITRARFFPVAVGEPLVVKAETACGVLTKQTAGPARQGDVIVVTLETDAGQGLLVTGRLVDFERRPLPDLHFELALMFRSRPDEWTGQAVRTRCDQQGRFGVLLPVSSDPELEDCEIYLQGQAEFGATFGRRDILATRLAGNFDASNGQLELGAIEMAPQPLLVAGQVVNLRGEPVAGASVEVEFDVQDSRANPQPRAIAGQQNQGISVSSFRGHIQRPHSNSWTATSKDHFSIGYLPGPVHTDPQGRFEIHGEAPWPGCRLKLAAWKFGHFLPRPVTVAVGEREAEITLETAVEIRGRLIGIPRPHELTITLHIEVPSGGKEGLEIKPSDAGAFRLRSSPQGP